MPTTPLLLVLFSSLLLSAGGEEGGTSLSGSWTQWRGPQRTGALAPGQPAWPTSLEGLHERWRVDGLGDSYAGPLVTETRVYSAETLDETLEVVRAFDRATGEPLWTAEWEGSISVPFFAARNGSWLRATPTLADGVLYVAGMRDVLVALDAETGAERWRVDFPARFGSDLPDFGYVSSPLVADGVLYTQAGGALVALDAATGETRWRSLTEGGDNQGMDSPFSSPVLAELAGRAQLVVLTRSHLAGVAPADGEVLWTRAIESFRGMNILTPVVVDDAVVTAPYGGRAQRIELVAGEDGLRTEQAWTNRAQGYMTSPVVRDGFAYLYTRANRFHCIDLATGDDAWISPPIGDDYHSLVLHGEALLALSSEGLLRLLEATPEEYRLVDEVELCEQGTWAHLAVAGGQLFVRAQNALLAFDWADVDAQ